MLQFSKEFDELMSGDTAILRMLSIAQAAFEAGDRSALFFAIELCARVQAVMPPWVVDALIVADNDLKSGKAKDMNYVFGWKHEDTRKRRRNDRLRRKGGSILEELLKHRLNGGTMNTEQAFQPIADKLGVGRNDVEAVYKKCGKFIKDIDPKNPDGGRHGLFNVDLPPISRRHGRPILRDG